MDYGKLNSIEHDHRSDAQRCLEEVIYDWLASGGETTTEKLAQALADPIVEEKGLAQKLLQKRVPSSSFHSSSTVNKDVPVLLVKSEQDTEISDKQTERDTRVLAAKEDPHTKTNSDVYDSVEVKEEAALQQRQQETREEIDTPEIMFFFIGGKYIYCQLSLNILTILILLLLFSLPILEETR